MPSNAPITIKDGAATPADHVFAPNSIDGRLAAFQEVNSGVPVGYPKLSISSREPVKNGAGVYRVVVKLTLPKAVTYTDASGKTVTTVDHTDTAEVTMLVGQTSTLQERKNLRVLIANALLTTQVAAVSDNLEFFW